MPEPPPVTIATLPLKSNDIFCLLGFESHFASGDLVHLGYDLGGIVTLRWINGPQRP